MTQTKREARATTLQAARLRRTLGEDGRAPFPLLLPLVVPEGRELLLVPVLLGDPEPEPEPEPPEPLPVLVLAGGATEQGSTT